MTEMCEDCINSVGVRPVNNPSTSPHGVILNAVKDLVFVKFFAKWLTKYILFSIMNIEKGKTSNGYAKVVNL